MKKRLFLAFCCLWLFLAPKRTDAFLDKIFSGISRFLGNNILGPLFEGTGEALVGKHVRHISKSIDNASNVLKNLPADLKKNIEPLLQRFDLISKELIKQANKATKERIEQAGKEGGKLIQQARVEILRLLKEADTICNKLVDKVDQRVKERLLQVQGILHAGIYHFDVVLENFVSNLDNKLKARIQQVDKAVKARIRQADESARLRIQQANEASQARIRDIKNIMQKTYGQGQITIANLSDLLPSEIFAKLPYLGNTKLTIKKTPSILTILPSVVLYQKKQGLDATFVVRHLPSNAIPYLLRNKKRIFPKIITKDGSSLGIHLDGSVEPGVYLVGLQGNKQEELVHRRIISIRKEPQITLESEISFGGQVFKPKKYLLEPGMIKDKEILIVPTSIKPEEMSIKIQVYKVSNETGKTETWKGLEGRQITFSGLTFSFYFKQDGFSQVLKKQCITKGPNTEAEFEALNKLVMKGSVTKEQQAQWYALTEIYHQKKTRACFQREVRFPLHKLYLRTFRLDSIEK